MKPNRNSSKLSKDHFINKARNAGRVAAQYQYRTSSDEELLKRYKYQEAVDIYKENYTASLVSAEVAAINRALKAGHERAKSGGTLPTNEKLTQKYPNEAERNAYIKGFNNNKPSEGKRQILKAEKLAKSHFHQKRETLFPQEKLMERFGLRGAVAYYGKLLKMKKQAKGTTKTQETQEIATKSHPNATLSIDPKPIIITRELTLPLIPDRYSNGIYENHIQTKFNQEIAPELTPRTMPFQALKRKASTEEQRPQRKRHKPIRYTN